jgi:hypothetical protein
MQWCWRVRLILQQICPHYKNSELAIEDRVADLITRMTLEEKVAQMQCVWQGKNQFLLDSAGNFDVEKARTHFKNGLGQVAGPAMRMGDSTLITLLFSPMPYRNILSKKRGWASLFFIMKSVCMVMLQRALPVCHSPLVCFNI